MIDVVALAKELNQLIREMYAEGDESMAWGRKLLAILRRYGIGE